MVESASSAVAVESSSPHVDLKGRVRRAAAPDRGHLGGGGLVGLAVVVLLTCLAVAAPLIAPQDPLAQHRADQFRGPSLTHLFGTDEFGRDILSRVIYGARISVVTGAVAVLLGAIVGIPLGILGGFVGGLTDAGIMRLLDCLLAVPAILLNALTPLVVQTAATAAVAMLLEAALSFLGLGTQPPAPSWGSMLNTGRSFLYQAPWYGLFPGLVITACVLALNALADGFQAIMDRGGTGAAARAARTA